MQLDGAQYITYINPCYYMVDCHMGIDRHFFETYTW